ncbi:heat shock factor protein 5 [Odontesthes bonariensis]|uniref:heat shock factor protein 5 n=1 Tax=Odontesthes bonariensis TaxID=219752 RepID=UPI003F58D66B
MDDDDHSLPDSINPNNFPAKLWRLVNNPANQAIRWDSLCEVIVIDQQLFEREILSPGTISPNEGTFKTTNFSSFVRQLNLYGFRKADPAVNDQVAMDSGAYHYFYNPNFQRNRPELVARLRRLTVDNKAKIQAGLDVSCRLPNRYQRLGGDGDTPLKRRSTPLPSHAHQQFTHPCHTDQSQAMKAQSGTPVPPRYLIRGHGAALSPTVYSAAKKMPAPSSHHYTGVASSSSAMHAQPGLLTSANHGNPNFCSFNPPNAHYQPGFYPTVCHCCHPNLVAPHVASLQAGLFCPQSYYQAGYPAKVFDHNRDLQHKENQEGNKCDINLDAVFQIADEVMQTLPNTCLVKVETPEKPAPLFGSPSNECNTTQCENSSSTATANSACAVPVIVSVLSAPPVLTYKQQEESVVSVPEQVPEDAIFEHALYPSGGNL